MEGGLTRGLAFFWSEPQMLSIRDGRTYGRTQRIIDTASLYVLHSMFSYIPTSTYDNGKLLVKPSVVYGGCHG